MTTTIDFPLPNPTREADPNWRTFSDYLRTHKISEEKSPAVRCYQCLDDESNGYVRSSHLNHSLSLLHFGVTGRYAELADDRYGTDIEYYDYQKSLTELDDIFASRAYRFTSHSVVFKGILFEPFYQVLNLESCKPGEVVLFPGFLSTSVCREKAESFCRGKEGILLVISGLDLVDAIVPENSKVPTSPTAHIPEQEVLLKRHTHMRVYDVERQGARNRVVYLQATN